LLLALLLYTFAVTYPWAWAWGGGWRSALQLAGDVARWGGNLPAAQWAYQRATEAQETPDAWLRLGHGLREGGDIEGALAAYRSAQSIAPAYIAAVAFRGDLLRAEGREAQARAVFSEQHIEQQALLEWSWQNLRPAPVTQLSVGDGLDFGYIQGVYKAEEQQGALARWSDGRAQLRLSAPPAARLLRLRLAAPRPDGGAHGLACAAGTCTPLTLAATWRTYTIVLPSSAGPQLLVEIQSDTFLAQDGRRVGVLIDSVGVE
jgi:hypothetical protein